MSDNVLITVNRHALTSRDATIAEQQAKIDRLTENSKLPRVFDSVVRKIMNRDEWYESNEFKLLRLLNHYSASFKQILQDMADIIDLVAALKPGCEMRDEYTILQQQMRIMSMDAKVLWAAERKWSDQFSPKIFDESDIFSKEVKED